VSGSRFVAPAVSKFLKAEAAAVSRFLVRHPRFSRFLAHVPGASKLLPLPAVATVPHVAPIYNRRARKIRRPMLKL
jgi:hypothetical protein